MGEETTDLEKVGMFQDGPYDTDVTLFRVTTMADFAALMGRDPTEKDDPLRLGPGFPILPGFKIKAATNDWTFSPFLNLWEDEPYEDPGAWRRRYAAEQAELNISEQPFLSSVGEKSMNGLGTLYGTFTTEMEAFSPEKREVAEDELKGLPNVLTNPGKKGTGYGYLDICLNPYPEYMEDPYFDQLEKKQEMREEFEAGVVGNGVFVPGGHVNEYFDPNPFHDDRDPDGELETYDWDRLVGPNEGMEDKAPFYPANYPKIINGNKDVISPLERFPTYEEDEYVTPPGNVFRQTPAVRTDFEVPPHWDDPDRLAGPWKAQFGNRSRQTKSIADYNIKFRMNSNNFHMW